MEDFEFSGRRLAIDGVSGGHHDLSHHGSDPDKIRQYRLIQAFYAERFRTFVERMKSVQGVDGKPLLDSSVLMLCSGMSDGNEHTRDELPMVIRGTGGGRIAPNRVLEADRKLASLWRATMRLMGVDGEVVDSFGDAAGDLEELTA